MYKVLIMVLSMLSLIACRTLKKDVSKEKTVFITDTVTKVNNNSVWILKSSTSDSIGYIKGGEISHTLTPGDLAPVYTAEGNAVGRNYYSDSNNLSLKIAVKADGSIQIDCKADSFLAVISRMRQDSVLYENSKDSIYSAALYKAVDYREKETIQIGTPWHRAFLNISFAFLIGVLIGYLLKIIVDIKKLGRGIF